MNEKSRPIARFFFVSEGQQVITREITKPSYTLRREKKKQEQNDSKCKIQRHPKKLSFIIEGDVFKYLENIVKNRELPKNVEIQDLDFPFSPPNEFKIPSIEDLYPTSVFINTNNPRPILTTSN